MKSILLRNVRRSIASAAALILVVIWGVAASGAAPTVDCKAFILVDGRTGAVLAENNADASLVPASLTKLMTLYLTLESVAKGDADWSDTVAISEYANLISRQPSLSAFQLPTGKEYELRELFYMAAINSSNAAAITLAEGLSGSEKDFTARMNAKAKQFGFPDVVFANSSGLNNSDLFGHHPEGTAASQDTKLSARAMAAIAFRLTNDYPEYLEISSMKQTVIREGTADEIVVNATNALLPDKQFETRGARGLKTGYTANAGRCLAGYAERGGVAMITVVLGAPTSEERFRGSAKLLEYGFALDEASVSVGAEERLGELGYLFPDQLSLYSGRSGGSMLAFGDTGFGVMRNGKMDVLAINGNLYSVSGRGKAMRLDDADGVGMAAMTYFNRETQIVANGISSLKELEEALAKRIDYASSNYCFRVEGAFTPTLFSTINSRDKAASTPIKGAETNGVIIGFWNCQVSNAVLDEGFTFYYLNDSRTAGGVLEDAVFEGDSVAAVIDRLDTLETAYGAGHAFKLR